MGQNHEAAEASQVSSDYWVKKIGTKDVGKNPDPKLSSQAFLSHLRAKLNGSSNVDSSSV
ncbi:MAG: hypothetical protein JWL87_722 [Candidatus Adlerbacteria bacterium]|nr:hypothetical protein [Candidatus Adlerbacteria bacterium]